MILSCGGGIGWKIYRCYRKEKRRKFLQTRIPYPNNIYKNSMSTSIGDQLNDTSVREFVIFFFIKIVLFSYRRKDLLLYLYPIKIPSIKYKYKKPSCRLKILTYHQGLVGSVLCCKYIYEQQLFFC